MRTVGVDAPRAGACLLRAEVQGEHVLISVTVSSGLDRNFHATRVEPPRHFVDVDKALAVVSEFLHSFDAQTEPAPDDAG